MRTLKGISLLFLLLPACGQQLVEFPDAGGAGGSRGNGGTSSGGTSPLGGLSGTGGSSTKGAGGETNVGGASSFGGMTNVGGTNTATVTTSTGGTSHVGGATSFGGANSEGGLVGTSGGSSSATGGTNPTGGTVATGGTIGSGGTMAIGGTAATSGTTTMGGTDATGGAIATGGIDASVDAGCAQTPVQLGTAANFVVLAGSTVTSTGPTSVTGDLGVSPGTAVTGFGPGTLVGVQHAGDPTAAQGEADLTTAYNDAAGRTLCPVAVAGNLGGQTLTPGLYKSTSSLEISSGDLTLDAQGDADAVFIFQMASTLTTTSGRQVILSGNAQSTNVFWQVGTSATLGSTSAFQGTIMADQAVTMNSGATLNGRVLARVAAVTLDSNIIIRPAP